MGIRPEHVALSETAGDHAIPGEVMVVQNLGAETLVTARVGPRLVVARLFTDNAAVPPGALWLRFDPAHLHAFDADGQRIE